MKRVGCVSFVAWAPPTPPTAPALSLHGRQPVSHIVFGIGIIFEVEVLIDPNSDTGGRSIAPENENMYRYQSPQRNSFPMTTAYDASHPTQLTFSISQLPHRIPC